MKTCTFSKKITTGAIFILLSACTVGPDFIKPAAPDSKEYSSDPFPKEIGSKGKTQQFFQEQDVPANWWKLFNSPSLDALVNQAIESNPTLQSAQASLRQAQETYYGSRGVLLPSVDINPYISRETDAGAAAGTPDTPSLTYSIFNTSVNVSYALDIFGLNRRNIEALKANADNQRFTATATYVTLTANVVTAAIQEASLIEQIKETEDILKLQRQQLAITEAQFETGAVSKSAVLTQKIDIAQEVEQNLIALKQQRAKTHNQLSALLGRFPGDQLGPPLDFKTLHLPGKLPMSLPSKLVEQRPDIKAAEAVLHSASASIGVATANMLPQITLTASYGRQSNELNDFFSPEAVAWNMESSLMQPLFHGKQLFHQRKASIANYENAAAVYKNTVLTAFQNVADSLNALKFDAESAAATARVEQAANENLALTQEQVKVGAASHLALIDAYHSYQKERITLIQAETARYVDTAALFQALGGGWWNQEETAKPVSVESKANITKAAIKEHTKND